MTSYNKFTLLLLLQLMFEGNLEKPRGFIAIATPYFTNGYCSAEPEKAADKGKNFSIILEAEDTTNREARFLVFALITLKEQLREL